jgi:GT2 family glycosyltransferase
MLDFTVVICAYTMDRWDDLVAAVAAVRAQTLAAREVIVVIDHNPALWRRASDAFPGVNVLENTEARGLSGARNTGLRAARAQVIAFMDEDAVPARDWLHWLHAGYDDAQVLGVGGAIEPLWVEGRPRWFPPEFDWVVGCTYRGMPEQAAPVRNLIGCNMSFRRELFAALGGFRDGIGRIGSHPVGCEETELCIRAGRHWPDGRLSYQPLARVRHRVPVERASWRYFRARCFYEGRSKALVAALAGKTVGLSTERAYTWHTLPRGVLQGLRDTLRHGDPAGLARALTIAAGLFITAAGYLSGAVLGLARLPARPAAGAAVKEPAGQITLDVPRP